MSFLWCIIVSSQLVIPLSLTTWSSDKIVIMLLTNQKYFKDLSPLGIWKLAFFYQQWFCLNTLAEKVFLSWYSLLLKISIAEVHLFSASCTKTTCPASVTTHPDLFWWDLFLCFVSGGQWSWVMPCNVKIPKLIMAYSRIGGSRFSLWEFNHCKES